MLDKISSKNTEDLTKKGKNSERRSCQTGRHGAIRCIGANSEA